METEKQNVQNLFKKIQNEAFTIDKLKNIRNHSKQIEVILEDIRPKTALAKQIQIDTFNHLLQGNYRTIVEGGGGGCPECLSEAELILNRIILPLF